MKSDFDIIFQSLESVIPAQPFADQRAGGLCFFQGIIRNHNDGRAVKSLEYEADIPLSRAEARRIFAETRQKFDILDIKALHRIGHLRIGETAIWVAVSAAHREAAFDAVQYIVHEIKHRLPIWKKEHYVSGPSQWVKCSHSENLDPRIYYSRQTNLSMIGENGQRKLAEARVLVVGAGGLGNYALTHLASSGIGTIGICEHDVLALHNLHRQTLYTTEDLNQPKALLAKQRLQRLNPFVDIHIHQEKLTPDNIHRIAPAYDMIIDGTDNFETKFLLNDYCVLHHTPLIQASVYQLEGQLTFYQPRQEEAACLRCIWPQIPDPGCAGNCQQAGVIGFTPGILGTWQAAEAIKYFLGLQTLAPNETLFVNLLTNETGTIKQKRDPSCPVCSTSASITTLSPNHYKHTLFSINPEDLSPDGVAGFILVDIRESSECLLNPFPGAAKHTHIPQKNIIDNPSALDPRQKHLLICASGMRSLKTASLLQKKGMKNIFSLKDGISGLRTIMATRE